MAERRMFAKTIIDSDAFLNMPLSTQALYFHLSMRADDDGFVNNPKKVQRMVNCSDDDFRILVAKRYVLPFESGVCVIKHWRIHNIIQRDRYKPTVYAEEMAMLTTKENRAYTEAIPKCIQPVSKPYTQVSLGKVSIDKVSLSEPDRPTDTFGLTLDDAHQLQLDRDTIFSEAKRCGLPTKDYDMDKAMELYSKHGMDKLLDAIHKTAEQPESKRHWRYVTAILNSAEKEDKNSVW